MITGTARRTLVNFTSLLSSEIFSKAVQFFLFIYLARALGAEQFGIFSFSLAFGFVFIILVDFGFSHLLIREISRDRKKASKFLSHTVIAKLLFSLLTLGVAYLFLEVMNYDATVRIIALTMLSFSILQTFTELHSSVFKAFEQMQYEAMIKVGRMMVLVSSVVYVMSEGNTLATVSLMFVLTEILALLTSMSLVYSQFVKLQWSFNASYLKRLIKKSSLFCLSFAFGILYLYIDSIMLSKMKGVVEVGLYSAATNLVIALMFIPLVYAQSVYPVMSRLHLTAKKTLRFMFSRSIKYMIMLAFPFSIGIFLLSKEIISLLYGPEYASSATVLTILCWFLFFKFLNPIIGYTLMSINKQKTRLFSQGLAAGVNIILNFLLIPLFGIIGAASATLITEILFFCIYSTFIFRYGFPFVVLTYLVKPVIAVLAMIGVLYAIPDLVLGVLLSGVAYVGVLLFLGSVDREDKRLFQKIRDNI